MSAPLIETYHEGVVCPPYARLYSSVFSLLQKPANVKVESHIMSRGKKNEKVYKGIKVGYTRFRPGFSSK